MAAANLLSLLDDIATILDDVSAMTKVAAKKTAGLVGDDLAVNAEKVTGFVAERELPVVWGVAKGALINKIFLIPLALLMSAYLPWMVTFLLMLGGAYLAYEGVHKIHHKFFHSGEDAKRKDELRQAFRDGDIDMAEFEEQKINGAIRTDVILSAEIIVLALKTVSAEPLAVQLGVLTAIGYGMVLVVYGSVAVIVKVDDFGLQLQQKEGFVQTIGDALVHGSPKFMKGLGFVGTVAMLLVGGGIYAHNIKAIERTIHDFAVMTGVLEPVVPTLANGVVGLAVGAVALAGVKGAYAVTGMGGGDGH